MTNTNTQFNSEYNVKEDFIMQEFILERNLAKSSIRGYHNALNIYCRFQKQTLQELIIEADTEADKRIKPKNRTIKRRLQTFRTHLLQNKEYGTVMDYMTKIKSFYRHQEIEIPYINPLKHGTKQIMYEDIPQREHIIELLENVSNLKHRAIIYFMASSGSAIQEISNLTIADFIDATEDYHDNTTDFLKILEQLENQDDVIPLWKMTRQKTHYRYYTCNTSETTRAIIKYLRRRNKNTLKPSDKLFDISPSGITAFMSRLNKRLGYPYIKGRAFIHPHAFRSYHTGVLEDYDYACMLQGRKFNRIREAYFHVNPKRVKEEYMKHVKNLTLKPTKVITIESDEVKQLKLEHQKELQALEDTMKQRVALIEKKLEILLKEKKIKD